MQRTEIGFAPEEIVTSEPTRAARLKWVVVVESGLGTGHVVNAVACICATTGALVAGLVGPGGPDGGGEHHEGIPWVGCTVLAASPEALSDIRTKAAAAEGVFLVDMPAVAQRHRIYDDYLAELKETAPDELGTRAFSIVGPRNRVDRLVKRLPLLA